MKPIVSVSDFAHRLGTSARRLLEICEEIDGDKDSHYRFRSHRDAKNPDKVRHFRVPKAELKQLQKRIHRLLAGNLAHSDAAHGAVPRRSPLTNASKHLGKRTVVTMDVRKFFPSVRHYILQDMLRNEWHLGRDVAWILTRLVTLDAQLPQGAPTSPILANALLDLALDLPLSTRASNIGATNTRFLDDIALSGDDPRPLINPAIRGLSKRRLAIWRPGSRSKSRPKFRIMRNSGRQEVTGLVVNSRSGPSVPKAYRDGVRAAIHQLNTLSGVARAEAENSIRGKIAHIRQCNPGSADRLAAQLQCVLNAPT